MQSTIVDPALQQLSDPNLHQNVRSGFSSAATQASRWGTDANGFVKERAGVDLVSKFGELGLVGGGQAGRSGYSAAGGQNGFGNGAYKDDYDDDYSEVSTCTQPSRLRDISGLTNLDFALLQYHDAPAPSQSARAPATAAPAKKATPAAKKKDDDWDDFEDF